MSKWCGGVSLKVDYQFSGGELVKIIETVFKANKYSNAYETALECNSSKARFNPGKIFFLARSEGVWMWSL